MVKLSIVVIFHNMQREAKRTLYSLSTAHQRDVDAHAYEIIAVDNASADPLSAEFVQEFGPQFRLIRHDTDSVSPVEAVNIGVAAAQGRYVAIIVDGARMATPGLVGHTIRALEAFAAPVVYALSWHLGPDVQNTTIAQGYDQTREDALLADAGWREDGYALFSISTLAQSSGGGFLGTVPSEFSWVALPCEDFHALGGFEPRFCSPGGGFVNHHFRDRAVTRPETTLVAILGEGVFHQIHGGVATNVPVDDRPMEHFRREYKEITGSDYVAKPAPSPIHFGRLPQSARRFL